MHRLPATADDYKYSSAKKRGLRDKDGRNVLAFNQSVLSIPAYKTRGLSIWRAATETPIPTGVLFCPWIPLPKNCNRFVSTEKPDNLDADNISYTILYRRFYLQRVPVPAYHSPLTQMLKLGGAAHGSHFRVPLL